MSVTVVEFITLDGVIEDPDGSGGTAAGGWAFRHGPEAVAGDKFRLGERLETGVLLFGRTTWELFAKLWPGRTGEFADRLNAAAKLVASRTLGDVSAWHNSSLLQGELVDAVRRAKEYIAKHGTSCWEVDALAPDVLARLVRSAFREVMDAGDAEEQFIQ